MTSHKRTYALTPKGERWLNDAKLFAGLITYTILALVVYLNS